MENKYFSHFKKKTTKRTAHKARPEISFTDLGRTYFNLDFSAFQISALA